jgi:hypothetical protein
MDTENEQFEQVRKLLALKRYEQPPPRYFQEFSGKVIARLHALETVRPVSWRQRFGLDFEFHPAMIGAFGVVVCGLLLVGVISSSGGSQAAAPAFALAGDPAAFFASPSADPAFAGALTLAPIVSPDEIPASTIPVSSESPFGRLTPRAAQRTAFPFTPGN